jgi:hypothetical protein
MSEPTDPGLGDLDLDLARGVDAVCRRFEADWRGGRSAAIGDYLGEVPEEARAALQAELEALERELRQADETIARPAPDPIAEASTIALAGSPTHPTAGPSPTEVHEEATVAPRDESTVDLGPSARPPDASEPPHVRTSAITRSSAIRPAATEALSSRRGRPAPWTGRSPPMPRTSGRHAPGSGSARPRVADSRPILGPGRRRDCRSIVAEGRAPGRTASRR